MAQLSTTMSHAHSATAFHFFTSNFFLGIEPPAAPPPADPPATALLGSFSFLSDAAAEGAANAAGAADAEAAAGFLLASDMTLSDI
jgi:hypothetical protein